MATLKIVTNVDDMDGKTELGEDDAVGFRFAVDGIVYEIDTTAARAEKVRKFLEPYAAHARKVGKLPTTGPYLIERPTSSAPRGERSRTIAERRNTKAIRQWALDNGHELSDRGRIPADVVADYDNAHTKSGRLRLPATEPEPVPETVATPPAVTTTATVRKTGRVTKPKPKQPAFTSEAQTETA